MAKDGTINVQGVVTQVLPNAQFKVKVEGHDTSVVAHLNGKMRKNNIKVLLQDKVDLEISVYDMNKGRIIFRHKEG
jgi:translation initiation factor IF-1|tara:strand:- start:1358 stop:1585 length:228 start_codon:yes stop_codon:yes gene_type:complete